MIYLYSLYSAGILLIPVLVILAIIQEYLERKNYAKYSDGKLSEAIDLLIVIAISLTATAGVVISLIGVLTTQYSNVMLIFAIALILMMIITFGILIYYSLNKKE